MKKILSLILIVTLVLSLGMVGFATGNGGDPVPPETDPAGNVLGDQNDGDWTNVKFKKSITTIGNDGAKHPGEEFEFTVSSVSAKDEQNNDITPIPTINNFNIAVTEGTGEAIATVNLPTYTKVGTYVYKVQESLSNTAGMVYDTTEYTFTVIVINELNEDGTFKQLKRLILADENGKKTDVFENKYNAGSLTVNKTITGNNANFAETFPVKVTLTAPGTELINSTITVAGAVDTVGQTAYGNNVVEITFDVTNNSNVVISNIPAGVTYVVEEVGAVDGKIKGYTPSYDGETGTIVVSENKETKIKNDLSRDIATGISLDNIPYIILLVGAAIGIVALVVRRRKNFEY